MEALCQATTRNYHASRMGQEVWQQIISQEAPWDITVLHHWSHWLSIIRSQLDTHISCTIERMIDLRDYTQQARIDLLIEVDQDVIAD